MVQIITKTGTAIELSAEDNQVSGFVRATLTIQGQAYTGTVEDVTDINRPWVASTPIVTKARAAGGTHVAKFVGRVEGQSKSTTGVLSSMKQRPPSSQACSRMPTSSCGHARMRPTPRSLPPLQRIAQRGGSS